MINFHPAQILNHFTQMPMYINSLKGKNEMLHTQIFPFFMSSQVISIIEHYGTPFPMPVENSEWLGSTENTEEQFSCHENPRNWLLLLLA